MMAATETLRDPMNNITKRRSWRSACKLFRLGSEVPTGVVDLSGGWYAQGHEVNSQPLDRYCLAAYFTRGDHKNGTTGQPQSKIS